MKLLRLILQGFKSFADKTTIDFSDGMTVIVGPNGCGKSNISDAVRWVLGEQNVRQIRGQKAEDMIFSGSETRREKNGAEVTLVLDNSGRELPLDTTEVAITRRLLRNGDSDFYLNKRSCRLKDIQELLAPTGLGKGSMAIIGQNRVDQVLTAHADERRVIFEDVAGISLYRMRKTEGLRKLEKTAENMERVKDMMALLDEQLVPLKEGAEKARQYKSLTQEKRAIDATMGLLKLTSSGRMTARYENEALKLLDEGSLWQTKLSQASLAKETLEKDRLAHQETLRAAGEAMADAQREMERLRGDYRVKEEALSHAKEKGEELRESAEDQTEAEKEIAEEIASAKEELSCAEASCLAAKEDVSAKEAEKESLSKALAVAEDAYAKALALSQEKEKEKEKVSQQLVHAREDIDRLTAEIERHEKEEATLAGEEDAASRALSELLREEKEKTERLATLSEKGKKDSEALRDAENVRFRLGGEERKQESLLSAIRSQKAYLERADKEYASFSRVTKTIMEQADRFGEAIHGALGELIRVPDEYTEAAEAALGGQISYIVTDTTRSAGEIIRWLSEKHLGRTTFYPLESMHPRYNNGTEVMASKEPGICGIASALFSCQPMYQDLLDTLLGRTLIAEDLDAARRVAKKYGYRLRIVTRDGQLVNAGGSMTGGSMKKKENTYFGRKKEIADLYAREAEGEKALALCRTRRKEQEAACDALAEEVSREREEWQALKVELAALSARREGTERSMSERQSRLSLAKKQLKEERDKLSEAQSQVESLKKALSAFIELPAAAGNEEGERLRKALEEKQEALLASHVALTKAEESVSFGKRMLEERSRAEKELAADRVSLEKAVHDNETERKTLAEELISVGAAFKEAEAHWQKTRTRQESLSDDANGFVIRQREVDEAWKKAQAATAKIERDRAELEGKIAQFKAEEAEVLRQFEAWHMTRQQAEALRLSGSMADMERQGKNLARRMAQLGSVNPEGEEEYARQLARRTFYENQVADLAEARKGLETIISDIDQTMERQFAKAFQKINEEFGRIMQLMFRGGKARLELTDEAHPLEGGVEMYLQLPGKKRQPLSLMSGGERALTVIALLISFMAYRPAPFCFVDEIDAALDDANVERYSRMIGEYKKRTQFIVISHRKKTMEFADTLQGVTMAEKGVSSLITVKMKDYVE